LTQREDVLAIETESFTYDFLDRLTAVSGPYSHSYAYDEIGNITSMNGSSYTYGGSQPHGVTDIGDDDYEYDDNGNMTDRDGQSISWDVENRPVSIGSATFVYDGNGNRVKKTEGGETILYVNQFYEKNISTSTITTSYYLGKRLIAQREGTTLRYVHQDHLTGTAVMSSSSGSLISSIKYLPFGSTRSGSVNTDKQFTGQRLDGTGLYYYGARYYDPSIGRFISPDTMVQASTGMGKGTTLTVAVFSMSEQQRFSNPEYSATLSPQLLNRYSYVANSPLKYTDPSGHFIDWIFDVFAVLHDVVTLWNEPSWGNAGTLLADVVLGIVPFVPAGAGIAKGTVKIFNKAGNVVEGLKSYTQRHFRDNLMKIYGLSKNAAKGLEAHHMLPTNFGWFWNKFGNRLNIHHPRFGVFLEQSKHAKISWRYNNKWQNWIYRNQNATLDEVLEFAKELAKEFDIPEELLLF
jgi:RHS repeat-associated protein